jgi:hypothetical protein
MIEHTNPNAELRQALAKKGITSGLKLARFLKSPAVIFFLRGDDWSDAHAELRILGSGEILTFYPLPDDERIREACVDQAVETARDLTGVFEWSKAPFSNCWLPSDDVEYLHEEFLPQVPQPA